jgi:hypothetical protein
MFQEKPTQDKLDILYRKSLYLMALSLAKTQGLDEATVADIHKQYGDHLYVKGEYDGAMQQYVQTIGHVQASYVIRKVRGCERVPNSHYELLKFPPVSFWTLSGSTTS